MKWFILYLFFVLTGIQASVAQQYPMRNYRMADGLSNSVVFRCYQDSKGFMWFCTNYGLSRFDGTSFRNYSSKHGLGANTIMSVSAINDSVMLVSTYGGGLDIFTDTGITHYTTREGNMPGKILYATGDGNKLWLISTNTTTLYCVTNGVVRQVTVEDPAQNATRFHKMIKYGEQLLFTSSQGIYITNNIGSPTPFLRDIVHEPVTDVRIDNRGNIWAGLAGRILQIFDNKIIKEYKIESNLPPADLLIDRNNNVWIAGAEGGAFLLQNNEVKNITPMLGTGNSIINDLFEDREGNIWIATSGQGTYMLRSLDIVNYPVQEKKIRSYCRSLSQINDSEVIVGSVGTVSKWTNGKLNPMPVKGLSPDAHIYFAERSGNNLYIGTPDGMIIKSLINGTEKLVTSHKKSPLGVLSFLQEKDSIWIGSFDAIYRLKNGENIIDSTDIVLSTNRCNAIYRNKAGKLFLGTETGITVLSAGQHSHYDLSSSAAGNAVRNIFEDSRGIIWYVTDSGLAYHTRNGIARLTELHGLTHNKCNAMTEDKNGDLWVGTANGITNINPSTMQLNAIRDDNFENEVLSLCCVDSLLFAGMGDGMSVMRLEQSTRNYSPPLYIMSAKWGKEEIDMPRNLQLPYTERKLNIQFAALSFCNPKAIQYRYRISGISDNWYITTNKEVDLQALPAGDFIFMVSARVNNGEWGPSTMLPIHVPAPYWQNKWLITLLIITLSWLIYFVTRNLIEAREEKKRARIALYNRIIYLKQQALNALINPHFIFNCMNSIQHYMHSHDHYMANIYLADFAQLIRMTLEHARSAFIPLEEEINRIKLYLSLEQLRFGEDLKYQIFVDPDLPMHSLHIPNMIIQPYVENAIWHGIMPNKAEGIISVNFLKHSAHELMIQIKDNGIGINKSKALAKNNEKKSFGTKLTADRLHVLHQMLGQTFSVTITEMQGETGAVSGTLVEILLPLEPDENRLAQLDGTISGLSGTTNS